MGHSNSNHLWVMVFACVGAFLLILVLPIIGLSQDLVAGIAIAAMIIAHIWMMQGHSAHNNHKKHKEDGR